MRLTLELPSSATIDWNVLRDEEVFLYRRVGDQHRAVLAVGIREQVDAPEFDDHGVAKDWYFAALTYGWLGQDEQAGRTDASIWFIPRSVVEWTGSRVLLHVNAREQQKALAWTMRLMGQMSDDPQGLVLDWRARTTRSDYVSNVGVLMAHIQRGDIYEINYCTERTASASGFDPFSGFHSLLTNSQAPFAGFHRNGDRFVLCASPERFLSVEGRMVRGQPMKGTRPRSSDPVEDARAATELATDPKERSENIMALDVMRHDLSRVAASGSVQVPDLCKVIPYSRVHQMISTVTADLRGSLTPLDALRAAFPMASMTGAPKHRAMQLIDEVEVGSRGLFSGSLGFLAPDGTGDFNVVIRTALFDADSGHLSIRTGSALTALCDPEREWEECELKARSVIEALGHAE